MTGSLLRGLQRRGRNLFLRASVSKRRRTKKQNLEAWEKGALLLLLRFLDMTSEAASIPEAFHLAYVAARYQSRPLEGLGGWMAPTPVPEPIHTVALDVGPFVESRVDWPWAVAD